jgi:hypothetical protein
MNEPEYSRGVIVKFSRGAYVCQVFDRFDAVSNYWADK